MKFKKSLIVLCLLVMAFVLVGCKKDKPISTTDPYFALVSDGSRITDNQKITIDQGTALTDVITTVNLEGTVSYSYYDETGNQAISLDTNSFDSHVGATKEIKFTLVAQGGTERASVVIDLVIEDTVAPVITLVQDSITLMKTAKYNLVNNISRAIDQGRGHITEYVEIDLTGLPGATQDGNMLNTDSCNVGNGTIRYHYTDAAGNDGEAVMTVTITDVIETINFDVLDTDGNVSESYSHPLVWNPRLYSQYTVQEHAFGLTEPDRNFVFGLTYDYVKWYSENANERLVAQWAMVYVASADGTLKYMRHLQTNEAYLGQVDAVDPDGEPILDGNGDPVKVQGVIKVDPVKDWCSGTPTAFNKEWEPTAKGRMLANIIDHMEDGDICLVFMNVGDDINAPRLMAENMAALTDYSLGQKVSFTGEGPETFDPEAFGAMIYVPFDNETGSITTSIERGSSTPDYYDGVVLFKGSKTNVLNNDLITGYLTKLEGTATVAIDEMDLVAITQEAMLLEFVTANRADFEAYCASYQYDITTDEEQYYQEYATVKESLFQDWHAAKNVRYYYYFSYTDEETGITDRACRIYAVTYPELVKADDVVKTYAAVYIGNDAFTERDPDLSGDEFGFMLNSEEAMTTNGSGYLMVQAPYNKYFHIYSKDVLAKYYDGDSYPELKFGMVVVLNSEGYVVGVRNGIGVNTAGQQGSYKYLDENGDWQIESQDFNQTSFMKGVIDLVPEGGYVAIFQNRTGQALRSYGVRTFISPNGFRGEGETQTEQDKNAFTIDLTGLRFVFKDVTYLGEAKNMINIAGVEFEATIDDITMHESETSGYAIVGRLPANQNKVHVLTKAFLESDAYKNLETAPANQYGVAVICDQNGNIVQVRCYKKDAASYPGLVYYIDPETGDIAHALFSNEELWGSGANGDVLFNLEANVPTGGFAFWVYGEPISQDILKLVLDTTYAVGWAGNADYDVDFRELKVDYYRKAVEVYEGEDTPVVPEQPTSVWFAGKEYALTIDDSTMWAPETDLGYNFVGRLPINGDKVHALNYASLSLLEGLASNWGGFVLILDADGKFVQVNLTDNRIVRIEENAFVVTRGTTNPTSGLFNVLDGVQNAVPEGGMLLYVSSQGNPNLAKILTDKFDALSVAEVQAATWYPTTEETDPFPADAPVLPEASSAQVWFAGIEYTMTINDQTMWAADGPYNFVGRTPAQGDKLHALTYAGRSLLEGRKAEWGGFVLILDAEGKFVRAILTDRTVITIVGGEIQKAAGSSDVLSGVIDLIPEDGMMIYANHVGTDTNLALRLSTKFSKLTAAEITAATWYPTTQTTDPLPLDELAPLVAGYNDTITLGGNDYTITVNQEAMWKPASGYNFVGRLPENGDKLHAVTYEARSWLESCTAEWGGFVLILDADGKLVETRCQATVSEVVVNFKYTISDGVVTRGAFSATNNNVLEGALDLIPEGGMLVYASHTNTTTNLAHVLGTLLSQMNDDDLTTTVFYVARQSFDDIINLGGNDYTITVNQEAMWKPASGYNFVGRLPENGDKLHAVSYGFKRIAEACTAEWGGFVLILDADGKLVEARCQAKVSEVVVNFKYTISDGVVTRGAFSATNNNVLEGALDLIPEGGMLVYASHTGSTTNLAHVLGTLLSQMSDDELINTVFYKL